MEGSQRSPAPIAATTKISASARTAPSPLRPLPPKSLGQAYLLRHTAESSASPKSSAETTRATDGSWRPLSCKWVWIQPNARRHCHCWAVTQPKVDEGGG